MQQWKQATRSNIVVRHVMGKQELVVDELVRDAFIYENEIPATGLLIGVVS